RDAVVGGEGVVWAGDGRVLVAGTADTDAAPPGQWKQISVFLSPVDVHVNRMPVSGLVKRVIVTPGRFLPAYRSDAASANERTEIWIDHHGQTVVARQVVGVLARRVVCRWKPGTEGRGGELVGVLEIGFPDEACCPPT